MEGLPKIPGEIKDWSYFEFPKTPISKPRHLVNSLRIGASALLAMTPLGCGNSQSQVVSPEDLQITPISGSVSSEIIPTPTLEKGFKVFTSENYGYQIRIPENFSKPYEDDFFVGPLVKTKTLTGSVSLNIRANNTLTRKNENFENFMINTLNPVRKLLSNQEYDQAVESTKNFPINQRPLIDGERVQIVIFKTVSVTTSTDNKTGQVTDKLKDDTYHILFFPKGGGRVWEVQYEYPVSVWSSDTNKEETLVYDRPPFFETILPSLTINSTESEKIISQRASAKATESKPNLSTPTPQKENLTPYLEFISPYQNYQIERPRAWTTDSGVALTGGMSDVFDGERVNGVLTRITIRSEQLAGSEMTLEKYRDNVKDREITRALNVRTKLAYNGQRSLTIGVNKLRAYRLDGELSTATEAARTAMIVAVTPDRRGYIFSYYADGSVFGKEEATLNKVLSSFKELAAAK